MSINATLIGQMITFLILVWFTMKYVWPPVINAMQERQARISEGLAAAERGSEQLQKSQEEADKILRDARGQAQEIIAQANRRSTEMVEQAKAEAREEGERLLRAAEAEIEQERIRAREQLRQEVGKIAVLGARRVLEREIDEQSHKDLLDDLVAQI